MTADIATPPQADVTVVIPTLATRPELLDRAVASVSAQSGVTASTVVVVNGGRAAPDVLDALRANDRITLLEIPEPGVSGARLAGRRAVQTEFFAFLDDDDEFLADGLAEPVTALRRDPALDVFVSNGYREADGVRTRCFDHFDGHTGNPQWDLVRENWLSSAGGVYRTATVGDDMLAELPDNFEMTLLAFRLAGDRKIYRSDRNAFIIHMDGPDRASESLRYSVDAQEILRQMAALATDPALRRALRKKRAAALHNCSNVCRAQGLYRRAWGYHLLSLVGGGGWRYISATRHLLAFSRAR